jgi:hypothetical protein
MITFDIFALDGEQTAVVLIQKAVGQDGLWHWFWRLRDMQGNMLRSGWR